MVGEPSTYPYEIPGNWTWTTFSELGQWGSGGTPSRKEPANYDGLIPWAKIGDLADGPLHQTEECISDRGLDQSSAKLLEPETFLIAMYGSIGKTAITKIRCATNQAIAFCRISPGLTSNEFARFYAEFRQPDLLARGQGGTQANISQTILKAYPIPLPPLAEQNRITDKIDALFAQIDAGDKALAEARVGIARFKKSILKAAVTGALTADWREANRDTLEPADALLSRILKERREQWEHDQIEKANAKGKPLTGDNWKKKYKEPVGPETDTLQGLPEGWVWASISQITSIKGGVTVDRKRTPLDPVKLPYLRVANVQRGFLNLTEVKEITVERARAADTVLQSGDILLNEGGDRDKLGRGWVWKGEIDNCIHQNHVFRARPISSEVVSEFVSHYANEFGPTFFFAKGKQTTNLASISLTALSALPVPLPAGLEQVEIIRRLKGELTKIDALDAELEAQQKRSKALRQAVLKAAFEGRVVPQDPDDEPASVLLERIRAERAAKPKPQRHRKSKPEAKA